METGEITTKDADLTVIRFMTECSMENDKKKVGFRMAQN